jgi:hypothetical protein
MLGVTVETMRRWETEGRLHMERSGAASAWSHLLTSPASWPNAARPEPSVRSSAARLAIASRIVTRIEKDSRRAVVEITPGRTGS